MKDIDFKKIGKMLQARDMTQEDLAASIGRDRSAISNWKKRGQIPDAAVPLLCRVLECSTKDLQVNKGSGKQDGLTAYIAEELGEIKGIVKAFEMNIFNLHNDIQQIKEIISPDLLTDKDKAVLLLKQMMGETGRVDEQDYVMKCNEIGIDNHSRKYAIEKADCKTQTMGYGSNAKRVIFKSVRGV